MNLSPTKKSLWHGLTLALVLGTSMMMAGCSKKPTVDTVKLQYIDAADKNTQTAINDAVEAADKGNSSVALAKLKTAVADPKLTAEQKSTINDVIQQLEKK
jgi:hypothetical protein